MPPFLRQVYGTCVLALLLCACGSSRPPRKFRLPDQLREASGLVITGDRMHWHNDSGDGPYLYTTDLYGNLLATDTLAAAAVDYEDLTRDRAGRLYVGDFGNNRGLRDRQVIYRYDTAARRTDSIVYTYPGQDGAGIDRPGNYNCEAMVAADGYLHLFTKDVLGRERPFYIHHFRLPARPGTYVAEPVDSLYLPRRVITGAALDAERGTLYLVAYNFRVLLGFLPVGGASLLELTDYPEGRFLRGKLRRRNLAWAIPTQQEAVAVYDDRYLYVAAEATAIRRHATVRRVRR